MFEDNKEGIQKPKSKNRQDNYQKKKDKRTNNELQNIIQTPKDRATQTH